MLGNKIFISDDGDRWSLQMSIIVMQLTYLTVQGDFINCSCHESFISHMLNDTLIQVDVYTK
jgi:hypothetical protein